MEALAQIGRAKRPEYWEGLQEIAVHRLNSGTDHVGPYIDQEPFATFVRTVPEFVAAKRDWDRGLVDPKLDRERVHSLTTEQLLQPHLTGIHLRRQTLAERTSRADHRLLVGSLKHESINIRALAACVLAEQGSSEGFEAARQLVLELGGHGTIVARTIATRALSAMPSDLVLPLARDWRSSRRSTLRHAGREILLSHANDDDIPWIRSQLRRRFNLGAEGELLFAVELGARLWHPAMLVDVTRLFGEFV